MAKPFSLRGSILEAGEGVNQRIFSASLAIQVSAAGPRSKVRYARWSELFPNRRTVVYRKFSKKVFSESGHGMLVMFNVTNSKGREHAMTKQQDKTDRIDVEALVSGDEDYLRAAMPVQGFLQRIDAELNVHAVGQAAGSPGSRPSARGKSSTGQSTAAHTV